MKEIVLFKSTDGDVTIPVRMEADSMWLTRMQMADLFGVTPQNITLHMKKVYASGELDERSTSKESLLVQMEGNRRICRSVLSYNLDAIISVGYRVNSARATQFRIWATRILKEYIVQGYAINKKRLQQLGQAIEVDVPQGRLKAHRRSYARRSHGNDRRISPGREGNDG